MIRRCKTHLTDVDEGYFIHMKFALQMGLLSLLAAMFLITHAFIPGIFLNNGSRTIEKISNIIAERKKQHAHHPPHTQH